MNDNRDIGSNSPENERGEHFGHITKQLIHLLDGLVSRGIRKWRQQDGEMMVYHTPMPGHGRFLMTRPGQKPHDQKGCGGHGLLFHYLLWAGDPPTYLNAV